MSFRPGARSFVLCSLVWPSTLLDAEYFPLETGHYIICDVHEQPYNFNSAPVQRTYRRKEVAGKACTDVMGRTAYRRMRYQRTTESQSGRDSHRKWPGFHQKWTQLPFCISTPV